MFLHFFCPTLKDFIYRPLGWSGAKRWFFGGVGFSFSTISVQFNIYMSRYAKRNEQNWLDVLVEFFFTDLFQEEYNSKLRFPRDLRRRTFPWPYPYGYDHQPAQTARHSQRFLTYPRILYRPLPRSFYCSY